MCICTVVNQWQLDSAAAIPLAKSEFAESVLQRLDRVRGIRIVRAVGDLVWIRGQVVKFGEVHTVVELHELCPIRRAHPLVGVVTDHDGVVAVRAGGWYGILACPELEQKVLPPVDGGNRLVRRRE